ncbi:MAG: energy transducer TonB [Crocinitomicaceae bacterium]|nr:energy transducer TonB [Crocinitomicaceae bacterium]
MIAKKNSGYDLENKRSAFFMLGLLVTGSLTLAAFTYSDPMLRADAGSDVPREQIAINFVLEPEKPKDVEETFNKHEVDDSQQQSTIDAQATVGEVIKITGSTPTVITGVGVETGGLLTGPILTKGGKVKIEDPEKLELFPDTEAMFVGGVNEMNKYIQSNVNYPQSSISRGEQGKVWVSFIVEKDGSITNIELENNVSTDLDREAKRVVRSFPNWIPGEVKMQKVRTRVRLPIKFILD